MILSKFRSVKLAYLYPKNDIVDDHWENIVPLLLKFHKVSQKVDAPMFNLWQFNLSGEQGRKYHDDSHKTWDYRPGTIRRCVNNAIGCWGLMLDYDGGTTIAQARKFLDGLEYVLYTSFRHSKVLDKFRVIIPFTRMITKEDLELKNDDIRKCFPNVDNASFSISQAFYFHSGSDETLAVADHVRGGAILDPYSFQDNEPEPVVTSCAAVATSYSNRY